MAGLNYYDTFIRVAPDDAPQKYGWGVHFDSKGRIALYGMESEEYRRFSEAEDGSFKLLSAMRNKKVK